MQGKNQSNQAIYEQAFLGAYKGLNTHQKQAVDAVEGPVMVIAGPGTGKTQILALRIANILKETGTPADGILCLTFTKSGVEAMRRRLRTYILGDAGKVEIATFHSFGTKIIEEFFGVIGLPHAPTTLEDADTIALYDQILNEHAWDHIRPRGNGAMYYRDLKSLISLLKREQQDPAQFIAEIEKDIAALSDDPKSISSRGETKGQLKKEIINKIEGLERTREVARFFEYYEELKREKNVMDYDDILSYLVTIARESEDARASIRERYLYVLVDEHQDSSGMQNAFLNIVWGSESGDEGLPTPNIFVVGDDRQLIYGFGGASLSHFEAFKKSFAGTKVITLTENYRSTQTILNVADTLLSSSIAEGKLQSQSTVHEPLYLVSAQYPRDEIIAAGLFFKEKIAAGIPLKECALLLPKNAQVRTAVAMLREMGLKAVAAQSLRLFDVREYETFKNILKVLNDPYATVAIAELVLDPISGIAPLVAHTFLHDTDSRKLSLDSLVRHLGDSNVKNSLFENSVAAFGKRLQVLLDDSSNKSVHSLIQEVGITFFLNDSGSNGTDHETYIRRIEVIRSFLHLADTLAERNPKSTLADFLGYIARLEEYNEHIPLATFGSSDGIQVMTLHGSKGLEFSAVWIAHMNERSLMGSKRMAFTLPESLKERIEKKDEEVAKRELYVAITRAKVFCTLSYSEMSNKGSEENLAAIIEAMPQGSFEFVDSATTEKHIMDADPLYFVGKAPVDDIESPLSRAELRALVAAEYTKTKVSVTLLNSFFDCPWKWYFRNFLCVPEPLSENLQFGSVVHGAVEHVIERTNGVSKNGAGVSSADIADIIDEEIRKCRIVDPRVIARFHKDAERAVTRFVESELPKLWEERESEKALSCRDAAFPEFLITGKIDLLESDTGEDVKVTDFKTGKTRTAKDIEKLDDENRMSDYLRQLAMYSYLINATQKGSMRVVSSRLYFVEEDDVKKAVYETTIDDEHIESLLRDIKDYDHALKSGDWTERTCHFKNYGTGETECPYCKRAKMYT